MILFLYVFRYSAHKSYFLEFWNLKLKMIETENSS